MATDLPRNRRHLSRRGIHRDRAPSSPAFTVFDEDFQGKAFFDNLIIAQLPRLEISTGHPGNIVESQTAPPIRVLVRDLTGDSIVAQIRVFDTGAREVDSQIIADGTRRVEVDWTPNLPGFGWYRAILEPSSSSGQPQASKTQTQECSPSTQT